MIFQRQMGHFRVFFCLFFLLIAAAFLSAGGTRDAVLSHTDSLIDQRLYDEAIHLLNEYVREKPDMFPEAQKRYQRIIRIREQFNAIADELLDALEFDPENDEKILELSERLMALGSASDSSTRDFLNRAWELAYFNTSRNRLERIMAQARLLLDQGNYAGALAAYAGGLDIYQAQYFSSGYGEEAEQIVAQGLAAINNLIADINQLMEPFNRAVIDFDNSLANILAASDPGSVIPAAITIIEPLIPYMERIPAIRADLSNVGEAYENLLKMQQQEDPNLGDRSFLSFAGRLINGSAGQDEGMIGAVGRLWVQKVSQAENAAMERAYQNYSAAYQALNNSQYSDTPTALNASRQYLVIAQEFIKYWSLFYELYDADYILVFDEAVISRKADDYLRYLSMDRTLNFFDLEYTIGSDDRALEYPALSSWQQGNLSTVAAVSMEQGSRLAYQSLESEIAVLLGQIDDEIHNFQNYGEVFSVTQNTAMGTMYSTYLEQARTIALQLEAQIQNQEYNAFVRQYSIYNEDLSQKILEREEEFAEGNRLIRGIVQRAEGTDAARESVAYYPAEGLEIITRMRANAAVALSEGRALLSSYAAEPQALTASSGGRTLYTAAQAMVARLEGLQNEAGTASATARAQADRAAALRLEGDRLFQESQAALAQNNFNMARERLQLAQDRYISSLAIQESSAVRTSWDTRFYSLGQDIVRIENEVVVRDVRNLVTSARSSYYSGNFDQAEQSLVRAQNRWRSTNSTEESEITYWLTLVRNAMSFSSGRVISATAPLYAEMSQLLSDAKLNYDEGIRLINAGRRQDGLRKFDEARAMTQKVELIFPLNEEARLLDLRIEQFTDPVSFNASFQQRLNSAVAGTGPSVRSVESFADLQNLAQINPNYPNIRRILDQAEIDMGYRPPPPDPQALARSVSLTSQAQPIINSRNSSMYEVALAWLNEAINLNPDNNDASILKDRLQILMTGTSLIVIDSKSYDEYQRAVMEFQRGNRYTAWSIVQELLQNPENRRSTQILDLQARIEATL
jgi:hypothetical protein